MDLGALLFALHHASATPFIRQVENLNATDPSTTDQTIFDQFTASPTAAAEGKVYYYACTVEPPIKDHPRKGQPPSKGHFWVPFSHF